MQRHPTQEEFVEQLQPERYAEWLNARIAENPEGDVGYTLLPHDCPVARYCRTLWPDSIWTITRTLIAADQKSHYGFPLGTLHKYYDALSDDRQQATVPGWIREFIDAIDTFGQIEPEYGSGYRAVSVSAVQAQETLAQVVADCAEVGVEL